MKLVLATRNRGKIKEIQDILKDLHLEILSCWDFQDLPHITEDGETFRENAIKKAESVSRQTGFPSLADDSGLEIEALRGKPGIYSSRFAGPEGNDTQNVEKVLRLMRNVPMDQRQARFRCVMALALPHEVTQTVEGRCDGLIALEPKGSTGFGYDPIFIIPAYGKTFAELGEGVKNKISHRAQALALARSLIIEKLKLVTHHSPH